MVILVQKRNMIQLNQTGSGQFAAYAGAVAATGENADADRHLFESGSVEAPQDLLLMER